MRAAMLARMARYIRTDDDTPAWPDPAARRERVLFRLSAALDPPPAASQPLRRRVFSVPWPSPDLISTPPSSPPARRSGTIFAPFWAWLFMDR